MDKRQRLVVVGNGMAGARFVEELLARGGGDQYHITVFGEEPYGNYNRILLSSVLAGSHQPEEIFLNPLPWYAEHGVRLHAGVRVSQVDRQTRKVYGAGQVVEPYDKLVLATGSAPFVPAVAGMTRDDGSFRSDVFVFRTLDDCEAILRRAQTARVAAVIGGGLLGLEAARGLLNQGLKVHVIHLMGHLMETQLDTSGGEVLAESLRRMGVQIHLEKATREILGDAQVEGLGFQDGSSLACDMVVISAGIRPNTALAKQAGLSVERGIVVHNDLSCRNDPNVYAIGECAQHRGKIYGLVAPLWEQGRVLADLLTGANPRASYQGSKVATKLKVMGLDVAVMGEKDASREDDEVVSYSEPARGVYKKLIVREGRLAGSIIMGDPSLAPRLLQAFDQDTPVPENRSELLFGGGGGIGATVETLPDAAQVCNCNGVSKGAILEAVRRGCRSMGALSGATRAGTGCGSCKPQVAALLELAAGGVMEEDRSAHYYVPAVPLGKLELTQVIKERNLRSVSAVLAELSEGNEDPGSKAGLASLLKTVWGKDYEDERDARFINDRVHANIQRDGTFSVVPRIYGGVTSPQQLRRIADTAEKHQVPMVKITGGQRIDLLGIPKEKLPEVWKDLDMPSGHAYTKAFRTCKTCVGSDFCRYGVGDSTRLGIEIETRFQGLESPHKMKLAASGCPRNCAEATTKDLGAVAIEGGRWEVYVGGAAGSRVRKGDVLCEVDTHEEVLRYMGRFMQYYRENAKYLERTYDFVERVGVDYLRRLLVEDSEGICARLDAEVQQAVDAYRDPWLEAEEPVHPAQFIRELEPSGLVEAMR